MWIRTASNRDLEQIRELLVETWHDTYDSIYGWQKVESITNDWHTVDALQRQLNAPNSEFVVADNGSTIEGMAYASDIGEGTVKLHQLYVRPRGQGTGIGRQLLEEMERCFPEGRRLRLEVEGENTKAIAFYHASGFEDVGTTDNCSAPGSGIAARIFEKPLNFMD